MTNPFKALALFTLSFVVVALGQPARVGWLGALAGILGFALFFACLPPSFSKARRFLTASSWFALVQLVQLSWMTSIEFQGYYILFVYLFLSVAIGLQFGLLTLFVPRTGTIPALHLLAIAALWTLAEWARLFFLCGFTWAPVGLALTGIVYSLQFASLFGIFGLSFWVMLTNLAALNAWRRKGGIKNWVFWLFLAGLPHFFGTAQLSYHLPRSQQRTETIKAALVQTDLLPSEKTLYPTRIHEYVSPLVQWEWIIRELKEKIISPCDMIVLPEAAISLASDKMLYSLHSARAILASRLGSGIHSHFPPLSPPYAEEKTVGGSRAIYVSNLFWCQTLSNYFRAELLIGLDHTDRESEKSYNSTFYFKPENGQIERYDKQVLLPLAEYLPFDWLKPLSQRYGIFDFFTPGKGAQVFGGKKIFSLSICYEETFPEIMREGKVKGAELFINVTNDNYFPNSTLHEQHLSHATLRAVENGIPLIRSCNSGVTSAIDCFGRVITRAESSTKGVVNSHLSAYTLATPYTFWGDGCIVSCCFLILVVTAIKKYFTSLLASLS